MLLPMRFQEPKPRAAVTVSRRRRLLAKRTQECNIVQENKLQDIFRNIIINKEIHRFCSRISIDAYSVHYNFVPQHITS